MKRARFLLVFVALGIISVQAGCVVVPAYKREHVGHATMRGSVDPLLTSADRKLHTSREAASGGDARPAGGGCGCSN